jgi:hypothetical protein
MREKDDETSNEKMPSFLGSSSPTGLRPPAQGWPNQRRPTLGMRAAKIEPQRGSACENWHDGEQGATALRLDRLVGTSPRVARNVQPWAEGHNAVGVEMPYSTLNAVILPFQERASMQPRIAISLHAVYDFCHGTYEH